MCPSYFPLRAGVQWRYTITDPIQSRRIVLRVGARQDIDLEDILTGAVRKEHAWILEWSDRERPLFAVERTDGVQMIERRSVTPQREALVVTTDLRWAGDAAWSVPYWRYVLGSLRYRRAGEEDMTVVAGTFHCLKIVFTDVDDEGAVWLAPEVGIVRSVTPIEGLLPTRYSVQELDGYTVP